ncbi:citrate synthase [Pullulanibacillus pueri]|uniref:Citrate synthase n=1 Tax=Pullulanibacillus pueri TaxID=1437324 RepID=A0A8J2ZYF1_9BACL|nr:citrate synthase [Pullulanibacillus pueri]MBM7683474.1 citrate synthase [Pullulanibacillus pueri]GGH86760.1 citrate synthase 2 [Pullulanibacillus pueri]
MPTTKGLEGVVATTSSVSSIIDGVLTYRGYNIDDLAEKSTFEEVVYLLWNDKLPTQTELDAFKKQLLEEMVVPKEIFDQIKALPLKNVHPMAVLRTAVSTLGVFDSEADEMTEEANKRKAVRLQAKLPTIVAGFTRIRDGKEPVAPRSDLSFAANFLYMLFDREPNEIEVEAFNKALILHADHELNASTFTARVAVATLSDIYSGITAAVCALKGPLHGGANERVMKMLTEIGSEDKIEPFLENAFANKEKIMGFGHRVYKNGDPRAKHLREMSRQLTQISGEPKWYNMSVKMDEIVTKEKGLRPNVDFYSASVYHSLGIPHDIFTPIFAVSRVSGWLAHILEQYANNRLIRPRAEYVGPDKQEYVAIEDRK